MPQTPAQPREASIDELISAFAEEHGVNPALAVAVAKKESSLNPQAIGDGNLPGGPSRGLFQLRPGTAADMGVDPSDPMANIVGGVKYLKFLDDKYGGDVEKVLSAYNGGFDHVDKGSVSPEAQAYAADVIASLSQGVRTAPAAPAPALQGPQRLGATGTTLGTGATIGAAPNPLEAGRRQAVKGLRDYILEPYDPRTPEGRKNLATTAAATAVTYGTGGSALLLQKGILPWVTRVLGPPVAAALTGFGEVAAEHAAGTTQENPLAAGAEQGVIEGIGQAVAWPFRAVLKKGLAGPVAREARDTLTRQFRATKTMGRDALEALRRLTTGALDASRDLGAADVSKTVKMGESAVRLAKDTGAARVAQVELENAARVQALTAQYDQLAGAAPDAMAPGRAVKDVVGGMPGHLGHQTGPAKHALDLAGQRVHAAAMTGPMIDVAPLQQELAQMGKDTLPRSILERRAAQNAPDAAEAMTVGGRDLRQMPSADATALARKAGMITGDETIETLKAQLPPEHPLPKLLGEFQQEGNSSLARDGKIPFVELHKWKTLLDSAVNFDQSSKDLVERMTKGLRSRIREAMAVHEPYNIATDAYRRLVPLYYDGVGKSLISAAADQPDRVAKLLNPAEPANAIAMRSLLVDQSAAGGNPEMGQQAWNAVRSTYTYEHLVKGGVEGLAERVQNLTRAHPEFARTVYGDAGGQQVLSNLFRLGEAVRIASEQNGVRLPAAKAIAKAGVDEARMVASHATSVTRDAAEGATRRLQRQSSEALRQEARTNLEAREGIQHRLSELGASSLAKFATRRGIEDTGADIVKAATAPTSRWGATALIRLLGGARSDELLEWAAYSNQNTQRVVRVLLDPGWDRGWASIARDAFSQINPMASHAQSPPQP